MDREPVKRRWRGAAVAAVAVATLAAAGCGEKSEPPIHPPVTAPTATAPATTTAPPATTTAPAKPPTRTGPSPRKSR